MVKYYKILDGFIVAGTPEESTITIYNSPNETEKQKIIDTLDITIHDVESALDPEEISRVEFTPEYIYLIWKKPDSALFEQQLKFGVSSVGIFFQQDKLTIISREENIPFFNMESKKINSLNDLVLRFFLHTISHYFEHLKVIKQLAAEIQMLLNKSMENNYLLQMFSLSESLIYYINALEGNSSVLTKLRIVAEKLGFKEDDVEILDDVIIEQQQCYRQMEIYSSILSGLMDARGNIINNNMNVLLKNLTMINVVFLPLTLITGIGGMSEFTVITGGENNWKVSYLLFILAMALVGWITWMIIDKRIHSSFKSKKSKKGK